MFYLHLNNGGKDILVYGNSLSYQLILFVRHMCCCFCKACLVNEYTLRYLVKSFSIKHYLQHHSPSYCLGLGITYARLKDLNIIHLKLY